MDPIALLLAAVVGAAMAAAVVHLAWARRAAVEGSALRERVAAAEAAVRTDEQLLDAYRSVAGATLHEQSEQLLQLATTRYQTLETTALGHWQTQGGRVVQQLEQQAAHLRELESQRRAESAVLATAVADLRRSNEEIRTEARQLAGALRDNSVRGTWGEVQLRRVLQQAGLERHADFLEQGGRSAGSGDRSGRPDVVVHLPDGRAVVIDAKVPLDRYLDAANCDDDTRRAELHAAHAKAVAGHAAALARRDYDSLVPGALDLVVMFLPGDAFLAAAAAAQPSLLEDAWDRGVVLASPSTLLGFLRGVALGWREQRIADQAEVIARTGRELHERLSVFAEHLDRVGTSLGRAVASYNGAVGSLEARVLPQARRFEDLGAGSSRSVDVVSTVDAGPRRLSVLPPLAAGVPSDRAGLTADSSDAVRDEAPPSAS
ncbi:DNA recombination protein RmuC [Dermatobacter hominis]|uniref:DNA recombination protein RmuC n=1 Tax=Dermatobacter hominis TaxID=2884263 RepID=UPI001D114404|nr:DNA recombination protein RmuC [Dermatobacter hominis]UDY34766.1 DNA recombination protein RmuC [Dermatobacter hominis]